MLKLHIAIFVFGKRRCKARLNVLIVIIITIIIIIRRRRRRRKNKRRSNRMLNVCVKRFDFYQNTAKRTV